MRRLIVDEFMTLDGVGQAPGGPEEDTTGGFAHGGWHMRHLDETAREWILDGIVSAGGFLLGRRTYDIFASYWPTAGRDEESVIANPLNTKPKFVASRTLRGPLAWENSTLLQGDLADSVRALLQEDAGDLHVIGSLGLLRSLIAHDLVDEYRLIIDPLVVGGGGKRVFPEDGVLRPLRLAESTVVSTGAIIATYVRADGVRRPRSSRHHVGAVPLYTGGGGIARGRITASNAR